MYGKRTAQGVIEVIVIVGSVLFILYTVIKGLKEGPSRQRVPTNSTTTKQAP